MSVSDSSAPDLRQLRRQAGLDAAHGAYLGNKLGDALGLPFEARSREWILAHEGGEVRAFRSPSELRVGDPWKIVGGIGATSDDWQLTNALHIAMIRMVREARVFKPEIIAQELISAKNTTTMGWGPSTYESVCQLEAYLASGGERGWSCLKPVPVTDKAKGRGNGAAIRVGPLVLAAQLLGWVRGSTEQEARALIPLCFQQAWMTHGDPLAWVGTLLIAQTLNQEFAERRNGYVPHPPMTLGHRLHSLRKFWQPAAFEYIRTESHLVHYLPDLLAAFNQVLRPLERLAKHPKSLVDMTIEEVIEITGTDCECHQSVPLAVAIYLRHPNSPEAALCEAASAGGDADSVAAMAGLCVGARNGPNAFPEWMRAQEGPEPRTLAQQLVEICVP